ncbi:MAG: xanthine dehydrogenase accessory protein XdhC [Pseudomonadota bacterium]|nr:xanthine dehydrogenase accessory protein XdhC [Pseudomonadota bacterium]
MNVFSHVAAALRDEGAAALVSVAAARGSAPREAGARMVVRPSGAFSGTIGGGALEWEAMADARDALVRGRGPAVRQTRLLGPQLGQCCGGQVELAIETFDRSDLAEIERLAAVEPPFSTRTTLGADGRSRREIADPAAGRETFGEAATPLLLFGAGHVGRALVLALAPLPFRVRWIDARPDAFPRYAPANVELIRTAAPEAEIDAAPEGAFVVVMTHSHPLDLAIVARALAAERFGYVGLIGSATKRARFLSQMRQAGLSEAALARLTCPIGVAGVADKAPAAIAAAVAAQLLQTRSVGGASA